MISSEYRGYTAEQKISRALRMIEQAQALMNEACSEISSVRGLVREWESIGKVADKVKAQWHKLNRRPVPRGGWKLDSEPE